MMKKCPACDVELTRKNVGPVEVDECEQCQGIWFDKDELRHAKDAMDSDLNWMDFEIWKHEKEFNPTPSSLTCRCCNKPMVSLAYGESAVAVDYCPSCQGTWLEKGEFAKIIDTLEQELLTKPFTDYVKEAIQEGAEVVTGDEGLLSEWKDFSTVLRLMEYRFFVENPNLLSMVKSVQQIIQ